MKQTIEDYMLEWNKEHSRFTISMNMAPGTRRPTNIEIRYSAAKYQDLTAYAWRRLIETVEANSHGTMYVTSDEKLFNRGIISIVVASSNHNYQERLIIGVLRWICEDFFTDNQ